MLSLISSASRSLGTLCLYSFLYKLKKIKAGNHLISWIYFNCRDLFLNLPSLREPQEILRRKTDAREIIFTNNPATRRHSRHQRLQFARSA